MPDGQGAFGFDVPASQRLVLPNDTQRLTVIGKTGSGKTQAGVWHLSQRSIDKRPWIVLNWKYDDLLDSIPGVKVHKLGDRLPKKSGVYVTHPGPQDFEAVDELLWNMWHRERIGLFVDEGYMIPARSAAFQALLTQGRSKQIPIIMLTQRPAWVTRFAFSEADFIQLFQLADTRDAKTVRQFMPLPIDRGLPPYHSYWWDNGRNFKAVLKPVPERDNILDTFRYRLLPSRRVI